VCCCCYPHSRYARLHFFISFPSAAPEQQDEKGLQERVFGCAPIKGLLGPAARAPKHGNWSRDETGYGGAGESEMRGEEEDGGGIGKGTARGRPKRVRRPAFHGARINYTKPWRCYASAGERRKGRERERES